MSFLNKKPTDEVSDEQVILNNQILRELFVEVQDNQKSIEHEFGVSIELPTFLGLLKSLRGKFKRGESDIYQPDLEFQKAYLKELRKLLEYLKKDPTEPLVGFSPKLTISLPIPSGSFLKGKMGNFLLRYFEERSKTPAVQEAVIQGGNIAFALAKLPPLPELVKAILTMPKVGLKSKPVVSEGKDKVVRLFLFDQIKFSDIVYAISLHKEKKRNEHELKSIEEDKRMRTWFEDRIGPPEQETLSLVDVDKAKASCKELLDFFKSQTNLKIKVSGQLHKEVSARVVVPIWFKYLPRDLYFYRSLFQWLNNLKKGYKLAKSKDPNFDLKEIGRSINILPEGIILNRKKEGGQLAFHAKKPNWKVGRFRTNIVVPLKSKPLEICDYLLGLRTVSSEKKD